MTMNKSTSNKKLRVAVYCRVGTGNMNQPAVYETQKKHYDKLFNAHENWDLNDIYIDEVLRTKTWPKPELNRLLWDCKKGKVDLIVTKSISRMYRNVVDAVSTTRELLELNPPVGIYFEDIDFNTLQTTSEQLIFATMVWLAAEESRTKRVALPRGHSYEYFNLISRNRNNNVHFEEETVNV
jgi:DNA invertase Pin-like site-specific DNA recombinase